MPRYSNYLFVALVVLGLVILLVQRPTEIPGPIMHVGSHPMPPSPAVSVPKTWIKIDTELGFTFYAPAGTKFRALQGIDTHLGEITGQDFKLIFELGGMAFGVREISNAREPVAIDNRNAEIVTADDLDVRQIMHVTFRHFVGLEMPCAICRYRTYGLPCQWDKLTIEGAARTADDAETIKTIYKSIRFSGHAGI